MKYQFPFLTICLLDACNKTCKHCYRTAIPSDHDFKLTFDETKKAITTVNSLGYSCMFAGGEPTIWCDGETSFVDLLNYAGKLHGEVWFISNGRIFEDKLKTKAFFDKLDTSFKLRMMFSIDGIHENYSRELSTIPFLDNIFEEYSIGINRNVFIRAISHWTTDEALNAPFEIFEKYKPRIAYEINDFMSWGRGTFIEHLACGVKLSNSDKNGLGSFGAVLCKRLIQNKHLQHESEFKSIPNTELIKIMGVCGKSPNFWISWGNNFFYCIPQMGVDWFALGEISKLSDDAIELFFTERPILKLIQEKSILGVVEEYSEIIGKDVIKQIMNTKESIRFAGCSICNTLFKSGAFEKINTLLLTQDKE